MLLVTVEGVEASKVSIDVRHLDGRKQEPESNVLLASVENMQYAITINVLHMVFSVSGTVQKIAVFEKNAGLRALIQYPGLFLPCFHVGLLSILL
ncbi:hypothetical protein COCNU_06G002870 [Cocos nucifera]|uniref:Uncharacterized protein n=1 Tax=Cocos nucifera TaxID=13894 RepID=A0A8K0I9Y8_COCNU|nr:hypothetical protein COCNU_06G002870 [Cocos nucifera]